MSKRKKKSSRTRSQAKGNVLSDQSPTRPSSTASQIDSSSPQEYEYVTKDLRLVTVLAAAMFALLFALSFFIG